MTTITVRLDDGLAAELAHMQTAGGFKSKSDMIREGLRLLRIQRRRRELTENLERYLADGEAQKDAARNVESRMHLTEESLKCSET